MIEKAVFRCQFRAQVRVGAADNQSTVFHNAPHGGATGPAFSTIHTEKGTAMSKRQTGFTLIELVMVIVILGLLAAVAIPKFVDLSSDARTAALSGVGGALSSASAVNYAARKANSAKGNAVANCTDVSTALQGAALPTGYTITAAAIAADASASCTLTHTTSGNTTTFSAIGIT